MPLFTPTIVFERITCITPEFLGARGLRALILDVDNTRGWIPCAPQA